jgi:predicted metalloprotease with PDZ domain
MSIKPAEYRGVDYRVQRPVPTLWFSEGLSIFYSDLMMRRAGFTASHATRAARLQSLLERYLSDPAYDRFSAEAISSVEYNSAPGTLGNYGPSTHLIGEVLGVVLDLIVREATDGRRTMDDVMRMMEERHTGKGFTGADIERAVADVCSCNVREFFDRHVRGGTRIDMNRYLAPLGLRMTARSTPAVTASGEAERDFRIRAWQATPTDTMRLMLWNPESIWARGGLNTNDRVLSINGVAVRSWPEFRTQIAAVPLGGAVKFEIVRDGKQLVVPITMSGYHRVQVELQELPQQSERQRRLLDQWAAGR